MNYFIFTILNLEFYRKASEDEIVQAFNDYLDYGAQKVVAGIIFQSGIAENQDFQYQIRWGVGSDYDLETQTAKLLDHWFTGLKQNLLQVKLFSGNLG